MWLTTDQPALTPPVMFEGLAPAVCERLAWDSQFFGLNIARLSAGRLTAKTAVAALDWCRDRNIDCLYFLADAADVTTAQLAHGSGFRFVGVRCRYECGPGALRTAIPYPAVRLAETDDLPGLESIAAANHRLTRFYFDGGFSQPRCDELYAAWIRRSCAGWADSVWVAGFSGAPAGYLTCHLGEGNSGSIGLIAVDEPFGGHGLGRQLVAAALAYFRERGVRRVEAVTQGRDVRSQRLFQRFGFVLRDVQVWYHLWPRRPA